MPFWGLCARSKPTSDMDGLLQTVQNDLFGLGADLATPEEKETDKGRVHITRVAPLRSRTWKCR